MLRVTCLRPYVFYCRLLKLDLLVIALVLMVRSNVWIVNFCRWSDVFVNIISKTGMFIYLKIAGVMCATVSHSTGFTANKLMLGREVNKSADLLFGVDKADRISQSPPDYVVRLGKILKEAHRVAGENLKSSVFYNKRDYDQRQYQTSYNTGDLVYVLDPVISMGKVLSYN